MHSFSYPKPIGTIFSHIKISLTFVFKKCCLWKKCSFLFCVVFWLFRQLEVLLQCNRLPSTDAFPRCRAFSTQASAGWKVKVSPDHVTARWAKRLEENPIYWHPFSALYAVSKNCWCYWGSLLVNCWNHTVPQHKTCPVSFQSKSMTCPWPKMQQWRWGIHQK